MWGSVMMRTKDFGRAMLVALGVMLAANGNAQSPPQTSATPTPEGTAQQGADARVEPVLEPRAIELLKAMSARLASARTMAFTAVSTYESPTHIGPPLAYTTISEVTLQRPNKLRVITPGDGPASEFYYDGKTMMAYIPAENLVAVADAPPTIDGALKAAYDSAAIYFPFTDVIVADPYQDIASELKHAFVIGQSQVVGGTTTDMVALVSDRVFGQVWIGADDKLPRMLRAVYADDPARLRHQIEFSNWRLDGQIAAEAFTSARAANASRMPFARPDPVLPPSTAPAPESKPSESK
jgi:hypothetical protein